MTNKIFLFEYYYQSNQLTLAESIGNDIFSQVLLYIEDSDIQEDIKHQYIFIIIVCYLYGWGTSKNIPKHYDYSFLYAMKDNPVAQNSLGNCYSSGLGVICNPQQAIYWYKLAAEHHYPPAQYNLGICYDTGYGVSIDYHQAFINYQQAAKQGFKDAQHNLGICYVIGQGITKNYKQAMKWLQLAQDNTTYYSIFSSMKKKNKDLLTNINQEKKKKNNDWIKIIPNTKQIPSTERYKSSNNTNITSDKFVIISEKKKFLEKRDVLDSKTNNTWIKIITSFDTTNKETIKQNAKQQSNWIIVTQK